MKKLFVKPGKGRVLTDRHGNRVPPEGAELEHDARLVRQLGNGDAVEAEKPKPGGKGSK